jgi:hypothetical protein
MSEDKPGRIKALRELVFESEDFRELLRTDIRAALKKVDIDPTPKNIALVKNVIDSIDNLYEGFGEHEKLVT